MPIHPVANPTRATAKNPAKSFMRIDMSPPKSIGRILKGFCAPLETVWGMIGTNEAKLELILNWGEQLEHFVFNCWPDGGDATQLEGSSYHTHQRATADNGMGACR